MGNSSGLLPFLASLFMVESLVQWIGFKALVRFAARRRQGWRPTGKAPGSKRPNVLRVYLAWFDVLAFGALVLGAFVYQAASDMAWPRLVATLPLTLSAAGMLFGVLRFGRAEMAYTATELATKLTVDDSQLPYRTPVDDDDVMEDGVPALD